MSDITGYCKKVNTSIRTGNWLKILVFMCFAHDINNFHWLDTYLNSDVSSAVEA